MSAVHVTADPLQPSLSSPNSCCDPWTHWTTSVGLCSPTSMCARAPRATRQVSACCVCPLSCVTAWEPATSPCVVQACRGQLANTPTLWYRLCSNTRLSAKIKINTEQRGWHAPLNLKSAALPQCLNSFLLRGVQQVHIWTLVCLLQRLTQRWLLAFFFFAGVPLMWHWNRPWS